MKRIYEHKNKLVDGFTKKYGLTKLFYFEEFSDVKEAIKREKQLKHWNREWKLDLIKKSNSKLEDLYENIV